MRVPALCYHRIEVPPAGATSDTNFVTPDRFASHLRLLASFGCTGVTIRDIARWQRGQLNLPARAIAITFDDAYTSVHTYAIPLLNELSWPCTIFVVTSEVGGSNAWDAHAPRAPLMDADTLRSLAAAGHEIGSHSRTHRRIRGLADAAAHDELSASRAALEAIVRVPVESFAFPYGSHDRRALDHVRDAGYNSACTLKRWANGRSSNPLRLGRMSVGGPMSAYTLTAKLCKLWLTPSRV